LTIYWITFRIEDEVVGGKSWDDRHNALVATIDRNSIRWWRETTSFIAFESTSSIDGLAYKFKAAIAPSTDLFLIGEMGAKPARICGRFTDRSIFEFMLDLGVV